MKSDKGETGSRPITMEWRSRVSVAVDLVGGSEQGSESQG